MFNTLSENLNNIFNKIRGRGILTEENIDDAMRGIRRALLEADVALPALRDFITKVKAKAKGEKVVQSVSPTQMVIKIINDEMINLLSPDASEVKINISSTPPANLLCVGLQGSGKTTASAKLALKFKQENKKVLLVSLDTYRPAAQEQLAILANKIEVDSLSIIKDQNPIEITKRAAKEAKLAGYDIVIYDSAGRLHIDDKMIDEVTEIKKLISPSETLLIVDSMIGQDAVNVATHFDKQLNITGVILSRIDGDARGGAAFSIRYVTGKPIKFLSTGEKPEDFEAFNAERIASRILGMGDVISLVEKASNLIDADEGAKAAFQLKKGKFDLNDYINQIKMIRKMGGLGSIMSMIPGVNKLMGKINKKLLSDAIFIQQEAIVHSMTPKERKNPDILNASRRMRIANGSGTSVQQVNILLKQFKQIASMIKKASKVGKANFMRGGINKFLP